MLVPLLQVSFHRLDYLFCNEILPVIFFFFFFFFMKINNFDLDTTFDLNSYISSALCLRNIISLVEFLLYLSDFSLDDFISARSPNTSELSHKDLNDLMDILGLKYVLKDVPCDRQSILKLGMIERACP